MKLTDLNPKFAGATGGRSGTSIIMDCPCGKCGDDHRLYIPFANPIDGGPNVDEFCKGWQRTGETFETLTLTPSILRIEGCKWHGYITNGEIVPC